VDLVTVSFCLALIFAGFVPGWLFGNDHGQARANRYHVDRKIADYKRAQELFRSKWTTEPDGSRTGPSVNEAAVEMLKTNPEEFFRLNRIWMETNHA
jgi:hypothetical protein